MRGSSFSHGGERGGHTWDIFQGEDPQRWAGWVGVEEEAEPEVEL